MLGHEFMRNAYLAGTFIALACEGRLAKRAEAIPGDGTVPAAALRRI